MADNVDISLKLGTEADISSAINAGARAGAAFAAAAQSAVNGISLSASTSMRAFATSSRQISSNADVSQEIRKLGFTNSIVAAAVAKTATGGRGGFLPPPSKPFAATWPQLPPTGRTNVGFYRGDPRYWGGTTTAPVPVDQLAANDNISKVVAYQQAILRIQRGAFGSDGRGGHFGGGGGGIFDAEYTEGGKGMPLKARYYKALGTAKMAQQELEPLADYIGETYRAGYRAETARSVAGFRQEKLEKDTAFWGMMSKYGEIGGVFAGGAMGAALGSVVPGLGTVIGGVIGGVAGLVMSEISKTEVEKKKQELEQQYKSLDEAQKRYYANTLFGGNYNVSFARAMSDLGLGVTEESAMQNSINALTFRGDLARGKISAGQMQALAFMPNTLANMINGETDEATLMAGYKADLGGIADDSLAASLARDTIGLGTWVTAQSGAYAQMANRWNAGTLGAAEARANSVVGGYINRHAQNVVTTQIADMAMFLKNAHDAPESFWGGQAKPTEKENDWATAIFNYARTTAMQNPLGTATPIIVNFVVDGETLKSVNIGDAIKERNSFLTGGQSFIAGGY